ncbi:unnamed protein product, partial [Durusdinium trenchii]
PSTMSRAWRIRNSTSRSSSATGSTHVDSPSSWPTFTRSSLAILRCQRIRRPI